MTDDDFDFDEDQADDEPGRRGAAFHHAGFYQRDVSWHESAVCAQIDGDIWFPEKGGSTKEAKVICGGCTVRAECLDYALETAQRWGIWGMTSERERRRLQKLIAGAA